MPEGLNSLRGQTVYGTEDFFEPVYVKRRRTRVGTEVSYTPGPVGFERRVDAGVGAASRTRASATSTSPTCITTGWYAAATWLVTGEDKEDFNHPRRSLCSTEASAPSRLALATRSSSSKATTRPVRHSATRGRNTSCGNSDRVWTIGVNWFPNRWVRVTVNGIREEFEDARRTPIPGTTEFWSALGRLQIVF